MLFNVAVRGIVRVSTNFVRFVRERGIGLALVVLFMYLVSLMQEAVSYTLVLGRLNIRVWHDFGFFAEVGTSVRSALVLLLTVLWLLGRKRVLFRAIVIANTLLTAALLVQAGFLMGVLAGLSSHAVSELITDVALMAAANILIFSIWYWIIDPPGVIADEPDPRPWAFLFPQRSDNLPGYETWAPHYFDYLFVAFTTSFAFSPTDTAPLSRAAKALTLLQSAISVVTLTGIASSAINILAGA